MAPLIKWAGGKSRLLSSLLPHFPVTIRDYHEPFFGGGSVFFAMRQRVQGRSYLADLNPDLVTTYGVVRSSVPELVDALAVHEAQDCEEYFYAVRATTPFDEVSRASRFLYLNRTAWNGLWRVNKHGVFNVPWGARPFRPPSIEHLQSVSQVLGDSPVVLEDFREALGKVAAGDFVYLDPPYLPVSDTSKFAGYTERRFRIADLAELASQCGRLHHAGASFVMSNRDTPAVRELFAGFRIVGLTARRSVAAQNRRDVEPRNSPEVIVTNV